MAAELLASSVIPKPTSAPAAPGIQIQSDKSPKFFTDKELERITAEQKQYATETLKDLKTKEDIDKYTEEIFDFIVSYFESNNIRKLSAENLARRVLGFAYSDNSIYGKVANGKTDTFAKVLNDKWSELDKAKSVKIPQPQPQPQPQPLATPISPAASAASTVAPPVIATAPATATTVKTSSPAASAELEVENIRLEQRIAELRIKLRKIIIEKKPNQDKDFKIKLIGLLDELPYLYGLVGGLKLKQENKKEQKPQIKKGEKIVDFNIRLERWKQNNQEKDKSESFQTGSISAIKTELKSVEDEIYKNINFEGVSKKIESGHESVVSKLDKKWEVINAFTKTYRIDIKASAGDKDELARVKTKALIDIVKYRNEMSKIVTDLELKEVGDDVGKINQEEKDEQLKNPDHEKYPEYFIKKEILGILKNIEKEVGPDKDLKSELKYLDDLLYGFHWFGMEGEKAKIKSVEEYRNMNKGKALFADNPVFHFITSANIAISDYKKLDKLSALPHSDKKEVEVLEAYIGKLSDLEYLCRKPETVAILEKLRTANQNKEGEIARQLDEQGLNYTVRENILKALDSDAISDPVQREILEYKNDKGIFGGQKKKGQAYRSLLEAGHTDETIDAVWNKWTGVKQSRKDLEDRYKRKEINREQYLKEKQLTEDVFNNVCKKWDKNAPKSLISEMKEILNKKSATEKAPKIKISNSYLNRVKGLSSEAIKEISSKIKPIFSKPIDLEEAGEPVNAGPNVSNIIENVDKSTVENICSALGVAIAQHHFGDFSDEKETKKRKQEEGNGSDINKKNPDSAQTVSSHNDSKEYEKAKKLNKPTKSFSYKMNGVTVTWNVSKEEYDNIFAKNMKVRSKLEMWTRKLFGNK